jgi:hypothetical protein
MGVTRACLPMLHGVYGPQKHGASTAVRVVALQTLSLNLRCVLSQCRRFFMACETDSCFWQRQAHHHHVTLPLGYMTNRARGTHR